MKLKSFGLALGFLLFLSVAANAGRVTTNSSYGQIGLDIDPCGADCTIDNTLGATITGESFVSTSFPGDGIVVYDFDVTNLTGAYTFDITATGGAPILATDPGGNAGYGLFTCFSGTFTEDTPQCGGMPTGVTTSTDYGSLSGNVASFPVTGANSTDSFVFFVALNDAPVCDPTKPCPTGPGSPCVPSVETCVTPTVGVTASLETSGVPEPRLLPLLGIVLLAGFVLFRRWRVAH